MKSCVREILTILLKIGSSSQSCDIFEDKVFHFDDNYSNEQLIRYILKQEEIPKKAVDDMKFGLKSDGDHKFFFFMIVI